MSNKTEFDDFYPLDAFQRRPWGGMALHGGKGGDTPQADPRLAEMQLESLRQQGAVTDQMLSQSRELAPLQREALQFSLGSARTAYDQSQQDRQYALARRGQLDSAMQPFLDEAKNYDEGVRRSELMKEAGSDITQAFDAAQGQQTRGLQRQGVTMNSGRAAVLAQQGELAEAAARSAAGRKVSEAAKAEGLALRTGAVNMLNGAPAMASGATAAGATYGTAGLGLTNAGVAGLNSGLSTAAGSYGNMAGTAGQSYNQQLGIQTTARGQANARTDELVGTALGAGMMMLSDRNAKTNIKPVGHLDNGATVYTYQYIGGDGTTHMGVMADELQVIRPDAVGKFANGMLAVDYSRI
jgi:hypothetical protein